jgi:hypothetical protein
MGYSEQDECLHQENLVNHLSSVKKILFLAYHRHNPDTCSRHVTMECLEGLMTFKVDMFVKYFSSPAQVGYCELLATNNDWN